MTYMPSGDVYSGQMAVQAVATVLGFDVPTKRIQLVAAASDVVYVGPQGVTAATGMLVPQIQADGSFHPLELWVNGVDVLYLIGAAGGETVYWIAEQQAH
jgi:hypothetical protein